MSSPNPASLAVSVTPSDSVNFVQGECRSLYIGTAGNLSVVCGGNTVVFQNVPGGSVLPVEVTRVNNTGTTAGNIIALY